MDLSTANPTYGRRNEVAPINQSVKIWRRVGTIIGHIPVYQFDINGKFVQQLVMDEDEVGLIGFNPNIHTLIAPSVWPTLGQLSIPYDILSNANARWGFQINIFDTFFEIQDFNFVFATADNKLRPIVLAQVPYNLNDRNQFTIARQLLSVMVALFDQAPVDYNPQEYPTNFGPNNMANLSVAPASRMLLRVYNGLTRTGNITFTDKNNGDRAIAKGAVLETAGFPANALLNFNPLAETTDQVLSGRLQQTFTLPPLVVPTGINILPATPTTLDIGQPLQLKAEAQPVGAIVGDVRWVSNDPTIATIDERTGIVTAIRSGGVTIMAMGNDLRVRGTKDYIITNNQYIPPTPTAVTIDAPSRAVPQNIVMPLTFALSPADAPRNGTIQWASNNEDLATVNADGLFVAKQTNATANATVTISAIYSYTNGNNNTQVLTSQNLQITINTLIAPPSPITGPRLLKSSNNLPQVQVYNFATKKWQVKSETSGLVVYNKNTAQQRKLNQFDAIDTTETLASPQGIQYPMWDNELEQWVTDEERVKLDEQKAQFEKTRQEAKDNLEKIKQEAIDRLLSADPKYKDAFEKFITDTKID
jgi:hypothetical protein